MKIFVKESIIGKVRLFGPTNQIVVGSKSNVLVIIVRLGSDSDFDHEIRFQIIAKYKVLRDWRYGRSARTKKREGWGYSLLSPVTSQ